jgi:hypothetical protein
MTMVMVAYEHDPADHRPVHLAVAGRGARPGADAWQPALRDTVDGRRVVWIRSDTDGVVWLRDHAGERTVRRLT